MVEAGEDVAGDLYALVVYLHVNAHHDFLEGVQREELSLSELQLLEHLRGGAKPTIGQVAALLHVTDGGASRLADRLARRSLVRREESEHDYRSRRIYITERGEQAVTRLHVARINEIQAFAGQLTEKERRQLHTALQPVRDRLAPFRPQPLPA